MRNAQLKRSRQLGGSSGRAWRKWRTWRLSTRQRHNGVTGFETQVQRAAIVAIDDPRGATGKLSDLSAPLLRRCRLPPSSPVESIEVDERESSALGQPSIFCDVTTTT